MDKEIVIKKIDNADNDYAAYFRSGFLQATFCLFFKDTVYGACALANFSEMLQAKYEDIRIKTVIGADKLKIRNPELIYEITRMEVINDTGTHCKSGGGYDIGRGL